MAGTSGVRSSGRQATLARMAKRRKKAVEKYHDRVANVYDHSYMNEYWQWHDAITWEHIKSFLPADQRSPVLDLGCGTGKWAAKLAKSGFDVTCVDISHAMIEQSRHKLKDMTDRAAFVQADLCDLSALEAGRFGLAVAMGDPIGCTSSPAKALKEIRRSLADDGVLVATFDNKLSALEYYLHKGDARAMGDFLRKGRTRWITRDREEQFEIFTYTPAELVKLVEQAGFEVLDLIGKTVLPMRHYRHLLEEAVDRRAWMKVEKGLCRDAAGMGRASHLQIAARRGR